MKNPPDAEADADLLPHQILLVGLPPIIATAIQFSYFTDGLRISEKVPDSVGCGFRICHIASFVPVR